jgi:hypothetical protein
MFRFPIGLGRYPSLFVLMRDQYGIAGLCWQRKKLTTDSTRNVTLWPAEAAGGSSCGQDAREPEIGGARSGRSGDRGETPARQA